MKTPEELERLAYINGHTEIADLLAQVIDLQDDVFKLDSELENTKLDYKEATE